MIRIDTADSCMAGDRLPLDGSHLRCLRCTEIMEATELMEAEELLWQHSESLG